MTSPTTTAQPTSVPPAQGGPRRYRLYTVEHLPFDALPDYRDGGPSQVVVGAWACSYSTGDHIDGAVLNLRKIETSIFERIGETVERHPRDGESFPSVRDASRAAFEGGALAFMVYEDQAARWGLPVDPAELTRSTR